MLRLVPHVGELGGVDVSCSHLNKMYHSKQEASETANRMRSELHRGFRVDRCGEGYHIRRAKWRGWNHTYHFLLATLTAGLWVPVWIWWTIGQRKN